MKQDRAKTEAGVEEMTEEAAEEEKAGKVLSY